LVSRCKAHIFERVHYIPMCCNQNSHPPLPQNVTFYVYVYFMYILSRRVYSSDSDKNNKSMSFQIVKVKDAQEKVIWIKIVNVYVQMVHTTAL